MVKASKVLRNDMVTMTVSDALDMFQMGTHWVQVFQPSSDPRKGFLQRTVQWNWTTILNHPNLTKLSVIAM